MPAAHSASAAFTYTRVGCSSASASLLPVPGTVSPRLSPPFLNSACLASEYPLLCRPELGSPITASPGRTLPPSSGVRSLGTAPIAVPTRSSVGPPFSDLASISPICAISPPGMAMPASSAPRNRPRATSSSTPSSIRSVAM